MRIVTTERQREALATRRPGPAGAASSARSVTERFSHALDIALSDGSINEVEGADLIAMAEAEPDLKPLERSRLADLVRSWQRVI